MKVGDIVLVSDWAGIPLDVDIPHYRYKVLVTSVPEHGSICGIIKDVIVNDVRNTLQSPKKGDRFWFAKFMADPIEGWD